MLSGLGPSAGLWGDGLRNRSQLGRTLAQERGRSSSAWRSDWRKLNCLGEFGILVLSVIGSGIVCDRNKLPNHLIDGWVEGCWIVPLTFP